MPRLFLRFFKKITVKLIIFVKLGIIRGKTNIKYSAKEEEYRG